MAAPLLRAAAREAALRDGRLHVVRTWTVRHTHRPAHVPRGAVPSLQDYEQDLRAGIERLVDDVVRDHPGLEVSVQVIRCVGPRCLVASATGADLFVVGWDRRRLRWSASVAERCVRLAPCPVLVVRADSQ